MPSHATINVLPGGGPAPWEGARPWAAASLMDAIAALSRLAATLVVSSPAELAQAWVTQAAERLPVPALHLVLRGGGETRFWSSTPGARPVDRWCQINDAIDAGEPVIASLDDGRDADGVRIVMPISGGGRPIGALIADVAPSATAHVSGVLDALRWPLGISLASLMERPRGEHAEASTAAHSIYAEMHRCETLTDLLSLLLGALPGLLGADWAAVAACDPQGRVLHVTTLDADGPLNLSEWARAMEACAATRDSGGRVVPLRLGDQTSGADWAWALFLRAGKSPLRYVLAVGAREERPGRAFIALLEEVAAHAEVRLALIVAAHELRFALDAHSRVLRSTQLITSLNKGESPEQVLAAVMGATLQETPGLTGETLHLWAGGELVHEQSAGTVPATLHRGTGLRWWQARLNECATTRRAGCSPLPETHDGGATLITVPILAGGPTDDSGRLLGVASLFATSLETVDLVLSTALSPFAHIIAQLVQNLEHHRALERANHELEQRRAQIIESKGALEAILAGFPDGLFIVDRDLRVTLSNDVQMLRVRESGPTAGPYCWELYGSGDGVCPGCRVMHTLRKGISTRRRMRVRRPGQPEREWEVATHPIARRSARSTQAALVIVRDVTEQEQIATSLAQVEKLAAVGRLAAGIAHEINNPLAAIQANVQLLLGNTAPDDDRFESLTIMRRSAERARRVVRNLLSFSEQSLDDLSPVDVNTTIRAALDLVSHQSQQRGVTLECHLAEPLPPVMASQEQLESVWLNLALNGLDAVLGAGAAGRIEVTSEVTPQGHVRVAFRDNGPGIAPHRLPHVFEPFGANTSPTVGTGLGLFSCHTVVKRHAGTISARPAEGGGSIFEVLLPALTESEEDPAGMSDVTAAGVA
jgi:two-component system, NtrC family, sensor kinase